MSRALAVIVSVLAFGCAPDASRQQDPLGGGSGDAGPEEEGVLCEPSWSTPLRLSTGSRDAVGEMSATLDGSGLHLELAADDGVGIGDVYVGVGVPPHLSWTYANTMPWRTGWLDVVEVDVPPEHLVGACGANLKIVVTARGRTATGVRWISAEGSNDMSPYGWYDLRPLCCDEPDGDLDDDGFEPPEDCDDGDAAVHPGADEIPFDGVDQDCDGHDFLIVAEQVLAHSSSVSSLELAYLSDGTTLRSWSTSSADVVQVLSPTGEVLMTSSVTGVAASDGGRFLFVFSQPTSSGQHTFGIFIFQDGSAGPSPFPITDPSGAGGIPVDVAYVGGQYLVVTRSPDNGVDDSFNGILVSQDGLVGPEFDVSETITPGLGAPHIVTDGDRFLVAYTDPEGPGGNTEQYLGADYALLGRFVDPATGPVGSELAMITREGVFGAIRVASNGASYLAVYQSGTVAAPLPDVYGQLFALDGTPIGAELVIEADASSQIGPVVIAHDGGYAVAWVDDRYAPDFTDDHRAVFVQRVSASGALEGDPTLVMASPPHTYESLQLLPHPDGALASWLLRTGDMTLFTSVLDL